MDAEPIILAPLPVVGIGASAGGIEALGLFFDNVPANSEAAFVVVLHLDPTKQSHLAAILARHTPMKVAEIIDGMVVEPAHVYCIAPNHDVTLVDDRLRLTEPEQPRGHRHPVDVLFASLAEQKHERAVAVVLSGTGTNGTHGLAAIKAAGGLMLVQDPQTAAFDGMPRSAISAGLADHVLAPAEMPSRIQAYLNHGYVTAVDAAPPAGVGGAADLNQVLPLLRAYSADQFRSYKPATLLRRIGRRMGLHNIADLASYIALLRKDAAEVHALASDMLISVTGFFRDPEAWAALDDMVITRLVEEREAGATLRVWVPACATGEEAYTVAMLLMARAEAAHKQFDLKLFGSDLLDNNLLVARNGVYPSASVETMPAERVSRFFERQEGSYRVRKDLRDQIVFARQDLLSDPPFSRVDLISCRNLLIYIEPEAQKRLLALFHFALGQGGVLFLGNAETVGRPEGAFDTISKKYRIYRRSGPARQELTALPLGAGRLVGTPPGDTAAAAEPSARVTDLVRRVLLDRYVPPAVLVDRDGRILYFHGETGLYLKQPTGEPTRNLMALVRDGLQTRLRAALQAAAEGNVVRFTGRVRQDSKTGSTLVKVSKLPVTSRRDDLLLVTFEPAAPAPHTERARPAAGPAAAAMAGHNVGHKEDEEEELRLVRAELQTTIELFESMSEELKAANEEATSMNEELQSTNEELETSKEELQSFNEELHSVNAQLQVKIAEVEEAGNDLANLIDSTGIAILFLDQFLRIKWFSPAIEKLFDLVATDIGRPIQHFSRKFADEALLRDGALVLEKLTPVEVEIQSNDDTSYLRRIVPYRTRENRIMGLVVTFTDATERKRVAATEARLEVNRVQAERISDRAQEVERANWELREQIDARKRVEDEMNYLAHHDRLTGLPNRRKFANLIPELLRESQASGLRLAILYLDLDRFKAVNDVQGHNAGDQVLQAVATRLSSLIRKSDIAARVGGDEFVAVLTGLRHHDEAAALADRIVRMLTDVIDLDGRPAQVGVSVGIAIAPTDGTDPEELLQNADMALYRAKQDGGANWKFFDPSMPQKRLRQQSIEADLQRALARDEFALVYQPQIDIASRRICGAEALLRWRHPEQGLLAPGEFIHVTEKTRLIVAIGAWVLKQACLDAAAWPDGVMLSVNVSPVQLRHVDLRQMVAGVLAVTAFPPRRLELEVTESALLENDSVNLVALHHMRTLGLRISLDDFGTGFSSLSHLRSFPYSKIKIDRSFVELLEQDQAALVIVRSIVALGAGLGMVVTAEGVETEGQLSVLAELGCAQAQGFLLGRPMPAEEFASRLADGA